MPGELVLRALGHAWGALQDRGINACVMGGMAIVHWGHARFTKDVDLLVSLDPKAAEVLATELRLEGLTPRRTPVVSRVGRHNFMQMMFTPKGRFEEIPVDLLLADSEFLRTAMNRTVPFRLENINCQVVSCEDLILLKLQADRLIDRMDVRYLLEYNRRALDFAYVNQWVRQLNLTAEWILWWEDAFPGEPTPTG